MAEQPKDTTQERHELERQRYRLQKELTGFSELGARIQDIERRAQQGDETAIRQMHQLEHQANGELGEQMKALLSQLDELHKKYERLSRLQKSVKSAGRPREFDESEGAAKLKKKRRNRIKYL